MSRHLTLLAMGAWLSVLTPKAWAVEEVDLWLEQLAQAARYSAVEGAGSQGSMGTIVGIGASRHENPSTSPFAQEELNLKKESPTQNTMPKLWLTKGLPWPVNLGLQAGYHQDTGVSYMAGHLQWSVFEAFQLPALALRADHSRIFGTRASEVSRSGVAAVLSWGFLRYFEIFGSYGYSRTLASVEVERSAGGSSIYILSKHDNYERFEKDFRTTTQSYGMKITLLPPFVAVSGEVLRDSLGLNSYTARIQVGL